MENKRKCKYCNKIFPITKFEITSVIKDKEYRRWRCSSCQNDSKNRRRRKMREWIGDLKKTLKCKTCDEDDFRVLDFHHNSNGDKDIEIANAIRCGWSRDRILVEIKKCKVLCCKCHRIFHWEERNKV